MRGVGRGRNSPLTIPQRRRSAGVAADGVSPRRASSAFGACLCGIAKDLTKTASKSAIKLTAGDASGRLFRWVAFFIGSKNAMKGLGFFLGRSLLEALGFRGALWAMAAMLGVILIAVVASLPPLMGKAKASKSARELFARNRGVNLLAGARVFLFGAHDVWFVVSLPVFLYASGWSFTMVGAFLAFWTIGYGIIQAAAPSVIRQSPDGLSSEVPAARHWSLELAVIPAALAVLVMAGAPWPDIIVPIGLCLSGVAFAVNSSVHSSLVLAYAGSEKAAKHVRFCYAANAAGRCTGTLLPGLLYAWAGLAACLIGSAIMLGLCWSLTLALPLSKVSGNMR